jgi:hypothetical protein
MLAEADDEAVLLEVLERDADGESAGRDRAGCDGVRGEDVLEVLPVARDTEVADDPALDG